MFGAWRGQLYSDNAKAFFEYVLQVHPEIHAVWITRNKKIYEELKGKCLPVQMRFSLRGILAIAQAGVAFETEGDQDISPLMNKKTIVFQLWHGAITPKRANWKGFNEQAERKKTNYWIASSDIGVYVLKELFDISDNHTIITGFPRNDIFSAPHKKSDVIVELETLYPNSKKIIYMPTHRNFGTEGRFFSEEEMISVDSALRENNIVMLIKPHFHELKNYKSMENKFSNIVIAKDQEKYSDVYSYLCDFDLLISDYSSIIYDFLSAKKPIVLFTFDIEHYRSSDAGLFEFYEEMPVGPFCNTWEDVVSNVVTMLHDNSQWRDILEERRKVFHPFDDGKNCERVYNATIKLLEKKDK